MQILTGIQPTRAALKSMRANGASLGLVPTMGALHQGHVSLVRAARATCDCVAASIFVNPLQFAPNEDLDRYPRTFDQDCAMLEAEGVDVLFAPSVQEMYPVPARTLVDVPGIGGRLDGSSRPGHFQGVATVVAKLFGILRPDRAFFGQKDAAQVAVLRAMVADLNMDIELIVCPTVRESDDLALSSRNRYLSPDERSSALAIPRAIKAVQDAMVDGHRDVSELRATLLEVLGRADGLRVDYAAIVDPDTLEAVVDLSSGALVAVAAWAGTTRLIDNGVIPQQGPA